MDSGVGSVSSRRVGDHEAGCLESLEGQAHRHRSLPDGRCHSLDRATADVAHTEDTGPARLEDERRHVWPLEAVGRDVGAGEEESVAVLGELPSSHPVRGSAPMKTNSPQIGSDDVSVLALFRRSTPLSC